MEFITKNSILCFLTEFSSRFSLLLEGSIPNINSNDKELLKLCMDTKSYKRLTSNSIEHFFNQISNNTTTSPVDIAHIDDILNVVKQLKH